MADEQINIQVSRVVGAARSSDPEFALVRIECLGENDKPIEITAAFPMKALKEFAFVALQVAGEYEHSKSGNLVRGGLTAQSLDVLQSKDGWLVLEFGLGQGTFPVALDPTLRAELAAQIR